MDYGQTARRPQDPSEGDTWTPIEPHPFPSGETVVWDGHAWVAQGLLEREAKGLTELPKPSTDVPFVPLAAGPQLTSREAVEAEGTGILKSQLAGAGFPEDLATSTAQDIADRKWAAQQTPKAVQVLEDAGVANVDPEAIFQQLLASRQGAVAEGGDIPWADLLGGEGAAPPIFTPEQERMLTDLRNAIDVGSMDENQAWKIVENYWSGEAAQSRRAEEAGRRGETLLAGAFPGTTFPGTGPGGIGAALAEKWGGPNLMPALKGIPMEQALGLFGQTQQQMGLPETLGPISPPKIQLPNWQRLGQAMPQFGGRNNYFDQLLQQGRSTTAPAL